MMDTLCGCRADKFDSCNNLLSSVHTILVISLQHVRLNIKTKKLLLLLLLSNIIVMNSTYGLHGSSAFIPLPSSAKNETLRTHEIKSSSIWLHLTKGKPLVTWKIQIHHKWTFKIIQIQIIYMKHTRKAIWSMCAYWWSGRYRNDAKIIYEASGSTFVGSGSKEQRNERAT